MHDRVRTILLLAAVFLIGAAPAFAQKKSLAELTAEDVQTRVKVYLESQGLDVELAEVVIDAAKIKLRKGTENVYTLEWAYSPVVGELPPAARKAVERKLQAILEHVLHEFRGGLVARQKQDRLQYRFVPEAGQARPVPLAQLTSALVRRQVTRFLAERPRLVGELEARVVLNVADLVYRKPSEGLALVWRVPRRALPTDEEGAVRKQLRAVLLAALGEYQGGLIGPKELQTLAPNVEIEFVNRAESARAPGTAYYPVCRLVCGCCGSCWIVEWHPYPASPGAAAMMVGESKPIAVERAPMFLPGTVPPEFGPVIGADAPSPARTIAARSWELRAPRDDELVDDYPKDALVCYQRGRAAYLRRDYGEARAYLTHAVQLNHRDARMWYFKALAELAMQRRDLANGSAQRGKDLEARGLPAGEPIRLSLQGVPEAAREFLAAIGVTAVAQPLASAR